MNDELEQQVREIAQEVHDQNSTSDQFAVSQVPFHTHNGSDSSRTKFIALSDVPTSYYGNAGKVATVNTSENGLSFSNSAGNVAGSDTQVQYNDTGVFGADSNFLWAKNAQGNSLGQLTINSKINIGDTLDISNPGIEISKKVGGNGDDFTILGSKGDTGGFRGGKVQITGGATTGGGSGGTVLLSGAPNTGDGGAASLTGADGSTNANGGAATVKGGAGNGTGGNGGNASITAGNGGSTSGNGGIVTITPGKAISGTNGTFDLQNAIATATAHRTVGSITTTDNSYTSAPDSFAMTSGSAGYIRAKVVGHRTGGSAGTANDSFAAELVVGTKNVAGTASLQTAITYVYLFGDQGTWDAKFIASSGSIFLQVLGATNNNVSWQYELWYMNV